MKAEKEKREMSVVGRMTKKEKERSTHLFSNKTSMKDINIIYCCFHLQNKIKYT